MGCSPGRTLSNDRDHGIGRFLHQPVARPLDDLATDVGRHQFGLLGTTRSVSSGNCAA